MADKVDKADNADNADKVEKIDKDKIDYNTDLEYLLKIHAEECESFSILHRYSYEKYNERSNYINIPVIILSSAIGFATGIDIGYDNMNIILGVSSIFVGIIKSIDTYFQLGKRSESHRLCSLQFQQINKKIMIELSLKRDQRISAKDMLQIIKTDIKNLQDIAPLIDEEIVKIFKKNYGEPDAISGKITFNAHTPNLCNGLTEVTVNGDRIINEYDNKNGDANGDGDNNKRRRRSSRERRRSRGSSPDSFGSKGDDDDNDDGRGGGGAGVGGAGVGRSSRNSRNSRNGGVGGGGGGGENANKKNDGNVSSASNSSGFMSSVSNFIKGGVNLLTGNRSRPASANSNSKPKVSSQDEYRERRKRNKENDNSAALLSLSPVLNEINNKQGTMNEIIEITDAVSYSGQQIGNTQNKLNIAYTSTPTHTSTPRHTPTLLLNNTIQTTGMQLHRPEPQQPYTDQLQHLQNLQQYFNSQQQTPVPTLEYAPALALASLPIPQLTTAASTPRISTPAIIPSNASNKSNKSNTSNILAAVSANLVYAAVNTNGSQNITPVASKPPSVKSEVEPMVIPHHQFMRNISIPDNGNIYESGADNNNVVIDILPLTHDNLSIHENSMMQQQQQQQQDLSTQVEIQITEVELPLVFDTLDPDGMM